MDKSDEIDGPTIEVAELGLLYRARYIPIFCVWNNGENAQPDNIDSAVFFLGVPKNRNSYRDLQEHVTLWEVL